MKVDELVDKAFADLERLRHTYHNRYLTTQGITHKDRAKACYEAVCKLPMQAPEAPWPVGDMECMWKRTGPKAGERVSTAKLMLDIVAALDTVLKVIPTSPYKAQLDQLAKRLSTKVSIILFKCELPREQ